MEVGDPITHLGGVPASRLPYNLQGRVVRSWVKITQGYCEICTQIWGFKKQIQFNSLRLQFDDWILQKE